MNGRERLTAIMHKEPADRPAWTTLVDDATLGGLPEGLAGMSGLDFYRHVGCEILLLNGWGTGVDFASPTLEWPAGVEVTTRQEGSRQITELVAGGARLVWERTGAHPTRFPVSTLEDVGLYRELWEGARYVERDDAPVFRETNALIGGDGIVTRYCPSSTIPRLLEFDMGTQNFYYLLHDHRQEMEALMRVMHERQMQEFDLLARGPCDVLILCENTSTFFISPDIYRRYNGPHVRDFVQAVHAANKTALVHMCGHVHDILEPIKQTGLDGIHALTPPPTGDTPWELALDVLGEDTILVGILDPSIFILAPLDEIPVALDALYTPRLRRANFCLWVAADGIRVPLERFEAVGAWMRGQGA
ncbi:MAG: hypothetical protein GX552_12265 [Chloroflexi bacterium]|nr:hypothetical protein [Chloroflexota bacterium]